MTEQAKAGLYTQLDEPLCARLLGNMRCHCLPHFLRKTHLEA